MTENIVTRVSTEEYKKGWEWKCPACGAVVDYREEEPLQIKAYCSVMGKNVKMVKVRR